MAQAGCVQQRSASRVRLIVFHNGRVNGAQRTISYNCWCSASLLIQSHGFISTVAGSSTRYMQPAGLCTFAYGAMYLEMQHVTNAARIRSLRCRYGLVLLFNQDNPSRASSGNCRRFKFASGGPRHHSFPQDVSARQQLQCTLGCCREHMLTSSALLGQILTHSLGLYMAREYADIEATRPGKQRCRHQTWPRILHMHRIVLIHTV